MKAWIVVAAALSAVPAASAQDAFDALRRLPVQDGGRIKPLDTFARETARRVTGARAFGRDSVQGLDPVEWLVAIQAAPDAWRQERIIRVSDAALRAHAGLPADRERYSFEELTGNAKLMAAADEARQRQDAGETMTAPEDGTLRLYGNLALMAAVIGGEAPSVAGGGGAGAWRPGASLTADVARGKVARARYDGLLAAYRAGGAADSSAAALAFSDSLAPLQAVSDAQRRGLDREVLYNRAKPFRLAWLLYLVAFLAFLTTQALPSRAVSVAGVAFMTAGFALQTWGFVLRTLIAERAPVANMYESIVFAAWGAVLFALVLGRHGARVFAACATGLAVVFLLLAESVPIFDAAIDPLAPVLRDNFWLSTHVLTITLGYAALLLTLALGHVSLALLFLGRGEARIRTVSGFTYRTMQAGTLLLAAGTLLGGVWASYSWGRFWGWDPKETWALIALLVYLAILHARFAGWIRDLGLAVGSIVGGLSVLMAWYGVNYVLGTGLHSYGFGAATGTGWVAAYVAVELALVAVVTWRVRAPRAAVPAASLVHAS